MCLNASKPQPDGPCFTLSHPGPNPSPPSDYGPNDLKHIPTRRDKYASEPDRLELYTFNPGSWDLASDILHTYFALSSYTQAATRSLPSSPASPSISLRISVNLELSSDALIPSPIELFVTSYAIAPLTLNVKGIIFDTSDWHSYLRIAQAGSSAELPIKPANEESSRAFSLGGRLLDYGFTKRVADTGDERPPHLITLYPKVPVQLPIQRPLPASFVANLRSDENEDDKRFLDDHKVEGQALFNTSNNLQKSLYERYQGSWEVGQRYAFELRDNATVPRWTWGTVEQLQGPYGLPALTINVKEGSNREFILVN